MRDITTQATNKVNIIGKLLDVTFGEGKLSDGRFYERATLTVRVNKTFDGKEEISEPQVSIFAPQYTSTGKPSAAFETIQKLKTFKTAQNVGLDEADRVRITGANIRENNFVTRGGQLVNTWQINTSFINEGRGSDIATLTVDGFIMDMYDETDREGEVTGRLIVKVGVVGYNSTLDVLEFVVEEPSKADYISRNWNINDTVNIVARIRVTSKEIQGPAKESSWGETISETSTQFVRELVITGGSDEGFEEEFAYDPTEIKKIFNVRKAKIEQLQMEARTAAQKPVEKPSAAKYSWE